MIYLAIAEGKILWGPKSDAEAVKHLPKEKEVRPKPHQFPLVSLGKLAMMSGIRLGGLTILSGISLG